MLKRKPIANPEINSDFFERCLGLFMGMESGHMGSDMYYQHDGKRIRKERVGQAVVEAMSGVSTWDDHAKFGSIPRMAEASFDNAIGDIVKTVGDSLPIVEYGPGSMNNAKKLITATSSRTYIPTDLSFGIIEQAKKLAASIDGCKVKPIIMDIFAENNATLVEEPALAVLLGLTITNLPGPAPVGLPRADLINAFRNLKRPIGRSGGYLLVSTHAEPDGARNVELYSEAWHRKFGVNFLYRMAEELPMQGFNPDHFEYVPVWHERSSLIAHGVRAMHDMRFALGEYEISVHAGQIFHYNNSFKFQPEFFESCAKAAGLKTVKSWKDENGMMLYLFEVSSIYAMQSIPDYSRHSSIYSLAS